MKKLAVVAIFLGLIGLNILTLVNSAVYNAMYGVLDNIIPASWMAESLANKLNDKDKDLKKTKSDLKAKEKKLRQTRAKVVGTRDKIKTRIAKNVSVNLASIPAESIPIIGIASIVAVTVMDLRDACDTMTDLDDLSVTLGFEDADPDTTKVCGETVPSKEKVMSDMGIDNATYHELKRDYEDWRMNLGGFIHYFFNEREWTN